MASDEQGRILTFYSYKGGTGRTLAVANVAWVLATNGKRVLVIDWDLEAPGLHRYFSPFLADPVYADTDGLIEFMLEYVLAAGRPAADDDSGGSDWYKSYADVSAHAEPILWTFPDGGRIDIIGAGRQNDQYPIKVNHFDWRGFYERFGGGEFLDEVARQMRRSYDYVLIDSRTGVSDTSGICTIHLPDALVVLFTLNNQSIEGASGIARDALRQRSALTVAEGDARTETREERPFLIYPIATRVELAEKVKLAKQREAARRHFGEFARRLERFGQIESIDEYFGRMEVLYDPYYAYEEELATIADQPGHQNSVLAAIELLTARVTEGATTRLAPGENWERAAARRRYHQRPATADDPAYDVFIAVRTPQSMQLARQLHALLSRHLEVFESSQSLRAGDQVVARTAAARSAASCIVVILSTEATKSEEFVREVADAVRGQTPVIPVFQGDDAERAWAAVIPSISSIRALHYEDPSDLPDLVAEILRATGRAQPTRESEEITADTSSWGRLEFDRRPWTTQIARVLPLSGRSLVVAAVAAVLVVATTTTSMLMRGPSDQAMLAALRGDAEPATVRAAYMQRLHENGRREFTDVNLAEVDLTDTQLVGADLSRADLSGADLSRAILDSVTFDGAVLADTRFVGSSLNFTSFVDARLSGTNLTAANLFAANLPGLDLADSAIVTTALTILPDSAAGPVLPGEDRSLATPGSPGAPGGSTGYVWIGNYTAEPSSWSLTLLANLALEPVVQDPRTMTTDGRYFVRASLSLREGLPQDDSIYFRGQTLTGVVPRGSEIELLGTPVAFQRGAAVHYWSEIRVICDSSAEDCTSPRFRISLIDTRDRELTQDLVARLVELGHAIDTTIAITRTPIDSVNLRCYHRADCSAAQPLLQVFLREFPDMRRGLNEQPARHPPGTLHFYY